MFKIRWNPVVVVFALMLGCWPVQAEEAPKETTAESRILENIKYLADDERDGRGIGTEGIEEAAEYLAKRFRDMGLDTDLFDGGPFQEFTTRTGVSSGEEGETHLSFVAPVMKSEDAKNAKASDDDQEERDGEEDEDSDEEEEEEDEDSEKEEQGEEDDDDEEEQDDESADESEQATTEAADIVELELGIDFNSLAIGGSGEFDSELVFAGYGITAEDLEYDDYADLDVEGKIVIVLRKEPQQEDGNSRFDGLKASKHAQFRSKIRNAGKHGAAAVLLVNDRLSPRSQKKEMQQRAATKWKSLNRMLKRMKTSENRDDPAFEKSLDQLSKDIESLQEQYEQIGDEFYDPLMGFQDIGARAMGDMPVFFVSRVQIDELLLDALGTGLEDLERKIDADCQPKSTVLTGWHAKGAAKVIQEKATIRNVVAVLEGSGPLANETVVVGAHYDHVGMGGRNSLAPWTTEVHNGADDNASGTTALIEIASRMAKQDKKPRRRHVFIAFTGEESGLLGSAHYAKSPRFPLDDTIAMLNLDMVGRLADNKLMIEGTGTAEEFDMLVSRINDRHGFKITKKASGFGASDHSSFYSKKIPVLFLFTGLHKDYHRPGDDWEKINIGGIERVVDYGMDILKAWDTSDERPTYVATRRGLIGSLVNEDRVVLGVMIDRQSAAEGVAVSGTSEGGPADKGGVESGDVIIKIDAKEVADIGDLRSILADHKDGDQVKVTIDRSGEEKVLDITLKKAG